MRCTCGRMSHYAEPVCSPFHNQSFCESDEQLFSSISHSSDAWIEAREALLPHPNYLVPYARSPASPRPGTMNARSSRDSSIAAVQIGTSGLHRASWPARTADFRRSSVGSASADLRRSLAGKAASNRRCASCALMCAAKTSSR
jgi:hypothetical protein